jgi:predicted dehydrogenase
MPAILREYSMIDVVKCADTIPERAKLFEEKFGCKATTVENIMGDPEIEIVLNLTFPSSHLEISRMALQAGKSVHNEKMMGVSWEDGLELFNLAKEFEKKGQWYTNAPDTFLGGIWQTARQVIDSGFIGTPIASYCLVTRGNMILGGERGTSTRRELPPQETPGDVRMPGFTRLPGVNPRGPAGSGLPYDMGGYYLHNLTNFFGNINRVNGFYTTRASYGSGDPLNTFYKSDKVNDEPDTISGTLEFDNGVFGSIIFASDIRDGDSKFIVYGSQGTLICPDPNFFGGKLYLQTLSSGGTNYSPQGIIDLPNYEIPLTHSILDQARGVGVVDLAFAIRNGRKPRCHYSMAMQAFETVHGIMDSADNNTTHKMVSHCDRPKAVAPGVYRGFEQQQVFDD